MEKQPENQKEIDKEIVLNDMINISQYIQSTNQASEYFNIFNELLYRNYKEWLDEVKINIQKGLKNSDQNINISDLNYDNNLLILIKKIAEPHNYRIIKERNINSNMSNENINNNFIFEKVEELTNFNDIIGVVNTCSKKKRNSLLAKIHQNEYNNHTNNENTYEKIDDNKRISPKNNFEIENDNNLYEDINITDSNMNNQKEKISYNNMNSYEQNEQEEENSLCTIEEQPSKEELEKNNTISQQSKYFNSNKYSKSNHLNEINFSNKNNNNNHNYLLDINNNKNTSIDIKTEISNENKKDIKPTNIFESISTTPQKNYNSQISQNLNNNINFFSNNNNKVIQDNLIYSNENSPNFGGMQNDYFTSSNKYNTKTKYAPKDNNSQFSFSNTNQKCSNNIEFTFSTIKKNNNLSNNKNISSHNKKDDVIIIHTIKKKNIENDYLSDNKNNKNSDNKHFINILTNSINNNINKNNLNSNIKLCNNNNNINSTNNFYNNEFPHQNYIHNVVLTSTKKMNNLNVDNKDVKIKQKYEDDFEEYEMSEDSLEEEEESQVDKNKFIPKWARDKEYINNRILEQDKDKNLVLKSFGKFVVEQLNLNMIFETHNELFDIRNSTADWRDDDSLSKNKVTNINDKEIDNIFPNRKLQF